jgi:hypothetical protein
VFSPPLAKLFEVTLGMGGIILVSQQKRLSVGNHPSWARNKINNSQHLSSATPQQVAKSPETRSL